MTLRLATPADATAFDAIVAEPAVSTWWLRDTWDRIAEEGTVAYAILVGGDVAGCIQYDGGDRSRLPPRRHRPVRRGRGSRGRALGSDALRTLIAHLIDDRGHHRLTIDPAAANERAIHVYRKLGFRQVGVMRRYERAEDGTWRDGLLMELVVDAEGRRLD